MKLKVRLIRFVLIAAAGIAFLAALFFARPLYLPDAFLILQIEKNVSAATGLDLSIQSGHIQLRKAIILRGITLHDATGKFSVAADELVLRYRLMSLLKRRAQFSEIRLSNAQIHIISQAQGAVQSPESSSPAKQAPKGASTHRSHSLPLEIQAATLELTNANFLWEAHSASDTLRLLIPRLNLLAQDARLDRQAGLRAAWKLEQDGVTSLEALGPSETRELMALSHLEFEVETLKDSSRIVARLSFNPRILSWSSQGAVQDLAGPSTTLNLDARLTHWRDLAIDSLDLSLEDLLSVQAAGSISDLFDAPRLDIRLPQASIFLESGWNFIHELTGQFGVDSSCDDWEMAGRLQLQEGSLQWTPASHPPDLRASLHLEISEASFECKSLNFMAGDLRAESEAQICLLPQDSLQLQCKAELTAGFVARSTDRNPLLKLDSLELGMSAEVGSGRSHPRGQLDWQARGPFGTRLEGNFTARADTLVLANPLLSPGSMLEGGASVDGLPLEELFSNGPSGDVSVALDLKAKSLDDADIKLGVFGWDVWYALGDKVVWLPPSLLKLDAACSLDPDFRRFYLRRGKAECNPYFAWEYADASTDFSHWEIQQSNLRLNLAEILSVLQSALPTRFAQALIGGQLQLKGPLRGSFDNGEIALLPECTLNSSEMTLAMPNLSLSADSVFFAAGLEGDWKNLAVSGEMQAGKLALTRLRESPYRQMVLDFRGKLREFRRLDSLECQLRSDELHLQTESRGWLDWAPPWPRGELANQIHFVAADTVFPLADLAGAGSLKADIRLTFESDSSFGVTGRVSADSLFVDHQGGWRIQNAHLELPFQQQAKFAHNTIEIPSAGVDEPSLPDPVQFAGLDHHNPSALNQGEFRADLIQVAPYVFEDLHGMIFLGQGFLHIPQMRARAYEGELCGAGKIQFTALQHDSIRYEIQCDAQRINSARLPGVRSSRGGLETEITAFARFHGRDFNLQRDHALGGRLEITQIGSRVADNILKFMDPEDDDPGIRTYRHYIRRGWGVRSFNFEVRDDFVYTSLVPAKPPISKPDMFLLSRLIGLGQSITFGRMPVSFFLTSQNTKPP